MVAAKIAGPLVCIVGVTGSGKSALALQLAERFGGELICADSRSVYEGMDIGTAKPTAAERMQIVHYGLDLVRPDQQFTVADFKAYAVQKIMDITKAGRLPILVGGTGLYVDAVLYDYSFRTPADPGLRKELNRLSVQELQRRIRAQGYTLPNNPQNPVHLARVLETGGQAGTAKPLRANSLLLGIDPDRTVLKKRLERRVAGMIQDGLIDEVRRLSDRYGWDVPAMQSTGYKAFRGYIEGTEKLEEAVATFVQSDLALAKRQRTWFRRNKSIHWLTTEEVYSKSVELITTKLNT